MFFFSCFYSTEVIATCRGCVEIIFKCFKLCQKLLMLKFIQSVSRSNISKIFKGGRFFRREKVYLPGVNFYVPKEPPSYTDKDMWVGNELVIHKHSFRLIAADEYALRYMELHSNEVC